MKPTLLCLHGWGGSKESFAELRESMKGEDIDILTPDLPGFGEEPEPDTAQSIDNCAEWVEQWLEKNWNGKSKLLLLGHSHGGRIAIKLVTRGNISPEHLLLCAAAGIKRPKHIKRIFGLSLAKGGKAILSLPGLSHLQRMSKKMLYKILRVHDYERASPVMRQTMINVSKEDLRPLLSSIKIPTDIFWGTEDTMTPYDDARIMEKEIQGSTLHTYSGVRHRIHRDKNKEIATIIRTKI
jgi:pimeloyl-ACP methyl ester carboxylesterase